MQRQLRYVKIQKLYQEPFDGTVYNLGVAEDHSYCVEGLVIHNCRCSTMSVSDSLLEREGWNVASADDIEALKFPDADEGFNSNPGKTEEI